MHFGDYFYTLVHQSLRVDAARVWCNLLRSRSLRRAVVPGQMVDGPHLRTAGFNWPDIAWPVIDSRGTVA
jgi:hypothetical protein